mmetsp:Transcript_38567/g.64725  ORF Transcript_38567/g.64725 Transcript_38567/m.64725 type:complete len:152 (+) Transcript_38567:97-552(+)
MIIANNGGAGNNDEDTGKFLSVDGDNGGKSMRKIDSWADFLNKLDEHDEKAKGGGNGIVGLPTLDMSTLQANHQQQQQQAGALTTRSGIGEAHNNNANGPGQNTTTTATTGSQAKDQVSWAQSHLLGNFREFNSLLSICIECEGGCACVRM